MDAKANQNYDVYNELQEGIDYEVNVQNQIVKLNLAGKGIMEFPPQPLDIQDRFLHLEELDISNNPIDSLSQDLERYKKLKILYVHACPLDEFPEVLYELPQLEQLSITDLEERFPMWFIQRMFDGLNVRSAYSHSPDLQVYKPLRLDATMSIFDFQQAIVTNDSGHTDNVLTLLNFKKQLEYAVTKLNELIPILKKYPNDAFHMQHDWGSIFVDSEASIMKEMVEKSIVTLWSRENE